MHLIEKEVFIRQKALEHVPDADEKIYWSLHAVGKLRRENLKKNDVERALKKSIIIEDYAMEGRPLPGCLVLGHISKKPVHAVIAIDAYNDRVFIITVYKPSVERWEDGWKKRK